MNQKEKLAARFCLGLALQTIIKGNKDAGLAGKVTSLRKLAASSGVEYSIIQKISSGKKDPQFTTLVALVEGLEMTMTEFFAYYEKISSEDMAKTVSSSRKNRKDGPKEK